MSPIKELLIILDNQRAVFLAGQTITGHVRMKVADERLKLRGIKLYFKGEAEVKWSETSSDSDGNSKTTYYSDEVSYFHKELFVFGNGTETYIEPGEYKYPFSFQLPENIPSSFEGRYGHVRYSVKANVDRPWKFDVKNKMYFTVNGILDLNKDPMAKNPGEQRDHKTLCCLCCKSGPISAVLTLDHLGYVPGERIFINAEIDNKSTSAMERSQVKLIQKITYLARRNKKKKKETTIWKQNGLAIPAGESDTWINVPIVLPALPQTNLVCCSIIRINYWIELNVSPSGMSTDLHLTQPIIIGSIPLVQGFQNFNRSAVDTTAHDNDTLGPSAPFQEYPEMPLPSYNEAVYGDDKKQNLKAKDDDDQTVGNWDYVPQYMVYNQDK